jgi:16S rRNA processing protein RimM
MIRIGKIVATHGLKGALILTHIVGNSKWLKKEKPLLIEMQKGSYIPYFVTEVKATNDEEYIVNLEDVDKIETAKKIVGRPVYVDEVVLADYAKQSPLLWIGFKVIDKHKGEIGIVEDILQTGKQWLAKLTWQNAEVLIPLIDQTIEKVDIKSKTIKVELPDGLLEVYL